jgi:hypothetical protein
VSSIALLLLAVANPQAQSDEPDPQAPVVSRVMATVGARVVPTVRPNWSRANGGTTPNPAAWSRMEDRVELRLDDYGRQTYELVFQ